MDPMSYFDVQGQLTDHSRHPHPRDAKYQVTHLSYHSSIISHVSGAFGTNAGLHGYATAKRRYRK
jgi:hypothetical protein